MLLKDLLLNLLMYSC